MCVWALGCGAWIAKAQESSLEYRVKAAYLLNFAKFVEWPTNRFETRTSPIKVGVLGKDPFGNDLDRTMAGRVLDGRKFEIIRTDDPEKARDCHIVFVSSSERKRLGEVIEMLHQKHVLTVGENEAFGEAGGIVRFFLYENTVRFKISAPAAEKAGVVISSKLLQVGKSREKS